MTTTAHVEINRSEVPVRLFESDFLEFFTHISPITVLAIWLPVAIYFLARGIIQYRTLVQPISGGSAWYIAVAFAVGIAVWSFTEYTLHRFVFHFHPRNPTQERIVFLFHGIHHLQPQCKTRLVMPPVVSVPLAFLFYGLYNVVVGVLLGAPQWVAPLFSGFIIGYLAYDMIHYATHHLPMRWGPLKWLKRNHMLHHYKSPDMRFGVSSTSWDYVFRTHPGEAK